MNNSTLKVMLSLSVLVGGCGSDVDGESTPTSPVVEVPEEESSVAISLAAIFDRHGVEQDWSQDEDSNAAAKVQAYTYCDIQADFVEDGNIKESYTQTIPYGIDVIRIAGLGFKGSYGLSFQMDCGDNYPYVTKELLLDNDGDKVFATAEPASVVLDYGTVEEIELSVWQQETIEDVLDPDWYREFTLNLSDDHAAMIVAMDNRSATATISGCTSSGSDEVLVLDYDPNVPALVGSAETADPSFLIVGTECTLAIDIKEDGSSRILGGTQFVAPAGNGIAYDLGDIPFNIVDSQLDLSLKYIGFTATFELDISELEDYLDSSTWTGDLSYEMVASQDGVEVLSTDLIRDGNELEGSMEPLDSGTYDFTFTIRDEAQDIISGGGELTLGEDDELSIALTYELILMAESANWTNVYFQASPEADINANGVLVEVEGYSIDDSSYSFVAVSAQCHTGTGNDPDQPFSEGESVHDGPQTCMVRLPYGHYCFVKYSFDGHKDVLQEVTIDDLDSIVMEWVVLEEI